ncbi:MAG: ATPase, T2SS/T4P/T4SS family [Candidatus Gastranaerophilales bacterium]|nr:ATPase, T2SS/T4P/T4SS family [Candidatus Gastranaerophilales bacterium]
MANQQITDKLKQIIDFSSVAQFDTEEFSQLGFIPLGQKNNLFYAAVLSGANQDAVQQIIEKTVSVHNCKFLVVEHVAFADVLNYIHQHSGMAQVATPSAIHDAPNEAVGEANPSQNSGSKKRIGEILIDMGFITEDQLFDALVVAKKSSVPVGTALVQKGYVSIADLKVALSAQQGFESVNADQLKIDSNILNILPEDFIKLNKVIPLSFDGKTLVVGMVNPNEKHVINDIVYLTGLRPRVMLITYYEFTMCLETYYNESKKETSQIMKSVEQESIEFSEEESLFEQAERELQDTSSSVVKFVNKIITDAIESHASDIHIEPRLAKFVVRYRIDGILREVLQLPAKSESAILTRLKVISKMNIAEHRRPQDGSFSIKYKNQDYDFRINTLPVAGKEKMVIRILTPAVAMTVQNQDIELNGAMDDDLERIKRIKSVPNGIILATGPTGSGKTTTLYALLKNINDEKINITTIEDPVEIRIEGVNQSQINTKAGITFASCLRAILRQDPDVILVGEIRDYETLEVAISAALTGHLVLSTLHTNSAAATITRLIEMGAKDYLISSTIAGVIAQRLVRRLCPHCKEEYHASREEAQLVVMNDKEIERFMQVPIYKPKGCEKCGFQGYEGRIGVYEVLQVTKEIKRQIALGAHDIQIEEAAIGTGMKTLQQSCLGHILRGDTTIDEFIRVLGPVNE